MKMAEYDMSIKYEVWCVIGRKVRRWSVVGP